MQTHYQDNGALEALAQRIENARAHYQQKYSIN